MKRFNITLDFEAPDLTAARGVFSIILSALRPLTPQSGFKKPTVRFTEVTEHYSGAGDVF